MNDWSHFVAFTLMFGSIVAMAFMLDQKKTGDKMFSIYDASVIKADLQRDDFWVVEFELMRRGLFGFRRQSVVRKKLIARQIGEWRNFDTWREIPFYMMDVYDAAFLKWKNGQALEEKE